MFDYIRPQCPLEGSPPALEWQTKDTPEQYLHTYTITKDGRLLAEDEGLVPFRGEITFYGAECEDSSRWWEYSALFDEGKMLNIRLIEKPE